MISRTLSYSLTLLLLLKNDPLNAVHLRNLFASTLVSVFYPFLLVEIINFGELGNLFLRRLLIGSLSLSLSHIMLEEEEEEDKETEECLYPPPPLPSVLSSIHH